MLDDVKMFVRYVGGLRKFLCRPLTPEECRQRIQEQMQRRDETFLQIVDRAIFANPRCPCPNTSLLSAPCRWHAGWR